MTDTGILTTLATIGMSLAGFAGIISAVLRRGEWRAIDTLVLRAQVSYGFATVLFALTPIALAGIVGPEAALRGAGVVLLVFSVIWGFIGARDSRRAGIEWRRRLGFTIVAPLQLATALWAALQPSLAVYEIAVIGLLSYTMPVFFFALTEARRRE